MKFSESGLTEREVVSMKGSSDNATYVESFKTSLTSNYKPRIVFSDRTIIDMVLALLLWDDVTDKDPRFISMSSYLATTLREYVYNQIFYKQGVKIHECEIKIDLTLKDSGLSLSEMFRDDVRRGRFFLMTPLHCMKYLNQGVGPE
jgi:hypothetical protein